MGDKTAARACRHRIGRMPNRPASPLRAELRFTQVRSGARIAWAASGQVASGSPPLVRVAHWMTHVEHDLISVIWKPWLERLGRELLVIRYDERGCGLSSNDEEPIGIDASVEELEAVIGAAGHDRVALLGMSGAAAAAIAYAVRYPARVSHLVLVGSYSQGLLSRSPTPDDVAFLESVIRLMELSWGKPVPAIQQFFTASMIPDATPEQAAALTEQQRRSCDASRAARIQRARAGIDVKALLPLVSCPTLVLHSEGDVVVPVELGRALAAEIRGARFETMPTRNHIPLAGDAAFERFCEAITDFVVPQSQGDAQFSTRERALLEAVARGLDNLQIAAHLGLAEKTVRNLLSQLYSKLAVEGRPQAIVWARERGYGRR